MESNFSEFGGGASSFESGIPNGLPVSPESNPWNPDYGKTDIREKKKKKVRHSPALSGSFTNETAKNIIKELEIDDSKMQRFVMVEVAMMDQIRRSRQINKLDNDRDNPNKSNNIYKLIRSNAEFYQEMAKEIKDDPENSNKLWEHHRRLHGKENDRGEKSGILAQAGVEDAVVRDLHFGFENVSSDKDVKEAIDGIIVVENENGEQEKILCQIKSVQFDNENSESFKFAKEHMVTVIYRSLAKRIENKSSFSEGIYSEKSLFIQRKEKQLNEIENKIFLNNSNERAVVIYIPSGYIKEGSRLVPALDEDGTMHREIKKIFVDQFNTKVLGKKDLGAEADAANKEIIKKAKKRRNN